MNFFDKLNKYDQRISFNIFALNGYLALFLYVYLSFFLGLDFAIWIIWLPVFATITAIYIVAFIVYCVEVVTKYKLPFEFLKNKKYTLVLLFGALISTAYLLFLLVFLASLLFMQF